MSQEKITTTIVRIAVARDESVFPIPTFAKIAVIPAKKVESKEYLRSMNCSYHSGKAEKNLFSVTGRRP